MDTRTGELKELEEVRRLSEEEQKHFKKVPKEYEEQAIECIERGRTAIGSSDPNFKKWAINQKRRAKAKRKRAKQSRRRNRG